MIAANNSLALAAALTLGLPAFPCRSNKAPACPHGWHDATADSVVLRELFRLYPGPLIGVPTGEASGLDALDIDSPRHPAAAWWSAHRHDLPQTRTHRTRSDGLHLLFRHAAGLRCWAGRPVVGVDGRSTGGYIVWWPATGEPVPCDAPLAPWPEWLLEALRPSYRAAPSGTGTARFVFSHHRRGEAPYASAALRSGADRVALAQVGSRNRALNAEAYGIGRLVADGLLDVQEVADTLAAAATAAGLSSREIVNTLRSAFRARGLM